MSGDVAIQLKERNWLIVPRDSRQGIELALGNCTAIFAYKIGDETAPYLVIHSPPLIIPLVPSIEFLMLQARTAREFFKSQGSSEQISLQEIIDTYETGLNGNSDGIGVYLASGFRIESTDLVIMRLIMDNPNYRLMGAELNQMVRARLTPHSGLIQFIGPIGDREIKSPYEIGQRYPVNRINS